MEIIYENDMIKMRLSNAMKLTIWELDTNMETLNNNKDLNGDWSLLC